jgi:hypothetical protein
MRVASRRVVSPQSAQFRSSAKTFPSPIMGQVVNENVATARIGGAKVLDNWRPTSTGVTLRGGARRHGTVSGALTALFTHDGGGTQKMFACTATSIFDATTPASPTTPLTAAITGQTSGDYVAAKMSTTGGDFTLVVNGADDMLLYDGAAFQAVNGSSSPIAITGVDTDTLSHVWVYRNRVFFVEEGTLNAWYLAVDSIGGTATVLPLTGIFPGGGTLMFGGRWSLDAGDGLDDKCVFVSSNGDAAVFEGSDPGDVNDWNMVGVYQIGRPLGKNASMQAGGDLLLGSVEGLVPISEAINKDRAALSLASPSRPIAPEWQKDAALYTNPWWVVKWPEKKIALIAIPATVGLEQKCRVINLETGAWAQYTGWDAQCAVEFRGEVFFGTSDGRILNAEQGGSDDGTPYIAAAVLQFDHFGEPGPIKTAQMARANFLASVPFTPQISASANYTVHLPAPPPGAEEGDVTNTWDNAIWDQAQWDSGLARNLSSRWVSIGVTGHTIAMQIQVTCAGSRTPDAELVSIDTTYITGGLVV